MRAPKPASHASRRTTMEEEEKEKAHRMSLDSLPQDLLVEIVTHVASSSPAPLRDTKNLRTACKILRNAANARKVGKFMAVHKEQARHWWDQHGYYTLLSYCARSNNLLATYIIGLHLIHNLGQTTLGLAHLLRASKGGHPAAKYSLGLILYPHPATRQRAMDLLNSVSFGKHLDNNNEVAAKCTTTTSGNRHVERCRRETKEVLRMITMKRIGLEPMVQCGNDLCGRVINNSNLWVLPENLCRSFCSQECRWRDEYYIFHGQL